jgi:hypothetical protein
MKMMKICDLHSLSLAANISPHLSFFFSYLLYRPPPTTMRKPSSQVTLAFFLDSTLQDKALAIAHFPVPLLRTVGYISLVLFLQTQQDLEAEFYAGAQFSLFFLSEL